MEKSLDFVVDAYSPHDPPGSYPSRRSRIGTSEHQNPETGEEEKENGKNADGLDRLSALPDILCQHIVSFVSATDARRTAFLSKRWRFVWCACPSFIFDEREFHVRPPPLLQWHTSRQNFVRFVDEAIEFRKTYFDDLSIEKFKVSIRFVEEVSSHLANWIDFALERNVRELSIVAEMKDLIAIAEFFHPFRIPYLLPKSVFTAKSIRCLELVFCDLRDVSGISIDLPFLKNLDMINVHINDAVFESILTGSPLLEKLNLSLVYGLEKIKISDERLKMLVVFKCLPLEEVVVRAPNIESFLFRGKRQNPDKIDVSYCRRLKFLWLQRASNLTDNMLEEITHRNPNLEIMILSHCSNLKNSVLHSPSLWMFVLFKCKHLISAKIHAPILRAFEYSGHIINFPSINSSAQLDAIIHMDGHEICGRWYAKLKEMWASFEHCRTLWIQCQHDVDLIIPHKLRKRLLPQLHGLTDLKIHVRCGSVNISQLEDGIRWIFPGLRNLYVESEGLTHHFRYWGGGGDVAPIWRRCRDFIRQERERF